MSPNAGQCKITFVTLGPEGTCHERAVAEYARFQGIEDYEFELITDFFVGLEAIRGRNDAFLVQCSAHPLVHEITEKYWTEIFVVDTFIYPTKHLVLLSRRDVETPRSLGIVPATKGYVDLSQWDEIVDVASKPLVAEGLLRGDYDSGLTHLEHVDEHADRLRLDLDIGEIDTTWVVYGTRKRFQGEVIGIPSLDLYRPAGSTSLVLTPLLAPVPSDQWRDIADQNAHRDRGQQRHDQRRVDVDEEDVNPDLL